MAGGIDWFRWHHGSVTDPKFALVARRAGATLPDVLAFWAYLLEHASASDVRGMFEPIDFEAWDCLFGFPDGRAEAIHDAMQDRSLIEAGKVISWGKRQPKREDETANERKRRQRERDHAEAMASVGVTNELSRDVTLGHADVTPGHAREEERREEKIRESGAAKPRPSRKAPEGFAPTPEMLAWAAEKAPGVDARAETEKFRDHTFANAMTDWPGAWRNWIRRSAEIGLSRNAQSGRGAASPASQDDIWAGAR